METTKEGIQMIEILATLPNTNYFEFFPGDWLVGGFGLTIAWCIKNGVGWKMDE